MSDHPPTALRAGTLLLAAPMLHGSYFGRSVILLTRTDPGEGIQGFILNRPATGQTLGDLLTAADLEPLYDVPVQEGGPVSSSDLILIGLRWDPMAGRLESRAPLGIAGAIQAREDGWEVRAFLGYTGWSPGQLEGEIGQGSWILGKPRKTALQSGQGTGVWSAMLRTMGDPKLSLLADLPDDPSLN